MLLFDLSAMVVKSCINLFHDDAKEPTINNVRHVAFSNILMYKKKYHKTHGTPVICVDSKPYWRELVFQHYKKNRDDSRDKSKIDWKMFSKSFKQVIEDMHGHLPYPIIDVSRCEGDDVICVLTQYAHARKDPVMIISSDKDMIQLQSMYSQVKQYSPAIGKLLSSSGSDYDILTHIIKGDASDGIPNIFSPDDIFINRAGRRQKVVTKKMLEEVHALDDPLEWKRLNKDEVAKFKRNKLLIDATMIPERLKTRIIETYESELAKKKPNRMRSFCITNRMGTLLESTQAF